MIPLLSKKSYWSFSLLEICLIKAFNLWLAPFVLACGYLFITSEIISKRLLSRNFIKASSMGTFKEWLTYSHVYLIFSKIFLAAKALPSRMVRFYSKICLKVTERMFSTIEASHYTSWGDIWIKSVSFKAFTLKETLTISSLVSIFLSKGYFSSSLLSAFCIFWVPKVSLGKMSSTFDLFLLGRKFEFWAYCFLSCFETNFSRLNNYNNRFIEKSIWYQCYKFYVWALLSI